MCCLICTTSRWLSNSVTSPSLWTTSARLTSSPPPPSHVLPPPRLKLPTWCINTPKLRVLVSLWYVACFAYGRAKLFLSVQLFNGRCQGETTAKRHELINISNVKRGRIRGNQIKQQSSQFCEIRILIDNGNVKWSLDGGGEWLCTGTICGAIGGQCPILAGPQK